MLLNAPFPGPLWFFRLFSFSKPYDIMSPAGAKRKLMTCASISELPCVIMSPAGAKRKLMTCAGISELPCVIMSPAGAKRKLMTCAGILKRGLLRGGRFCAPGLCDLQRCVDWSGRRNRFVRLRRTGTCPNETDKTAPVSDTFHTSADHRVPGRRPPPTREQ